MVSSGETEEPDFKMEKFRGEVTGRKIPTSAGEAPAPIDDAGPSYTISEFCIAERISQPTYHSLRRQGLGPATISLTSRIIRITSAARREWQARMAALSQQEAAKLEERRRREQASYAGKLGAASSLHVSKRPK